MSSTEQRLRDAFAAAAETVAPHTIRSLPRPLRPPRFCEQALIPLAAAAAVAAIAIAMTMVVPKVLVTAGGVHTGAGQSGPGQSGPGQSGAGGGGPGGGTHQARKLAPSGPLATVQPHEIAAGYVGGRLPGGAAPRYFVAIRQLPLETSGGSISSGAATASAVLATGMAVYSAATGQMVANVAQPGRGRYFQAVATLGSGQAFVAAAIPAQRSDCHTWFYRFSLGSLGRPTEVTPLSVPEVAGQVSYGTSLATSADGTLLAYSASMCSKNDSGRVGVIHLGTGQVCTWSTVWPAKPRNLSLSANGTLLSFVGNPSTGPEPLTPSADAVWTLRTASPPGPVASHYRRALYVSGGVQAAQLSPTGRVLFAITAGSPRPAARMLPDLDAYDTATGKRIGLVSRVSGGGHPPSLSGDFSGRYLLVYLLHLRSVQELNVATKQLRTVPVAQTSTPIGAAW